MALITDAGHNFSDVLALILSWAAAWMIKRQSTKNYTYGLKKGSILITLFNSVLLLVTLGAITLEAVKRLQTGTPVEGKTMIIVAAAGIVINGFTAFLFLKDKNKDLNIKSAFLHMLTDTFVSLGVVISGVFVVLYNVYWLDPVISILIVIVILQGTWKLLKEAFRLSIDAVPEGINIKSVENYLKSIDNVIDVHDLHIWALSTSQTALTTHLVSNMDNIDNEFIDKISRELEHKLGIINSTIQVESSDSEIDCNSCTD
jgi:cobalt-zinc-cadmium efflux system protein